MKRSKTDSSILELLLLSHKSNENQLNTRFNVGRILWTSPN